MLPTHLSAEQHPNHRFGVRVMQDGEGGGGVLAYVEWPPANQVKLGSIDLLRTVTVGFDPPCAFCAAATQPLQILPNEYEITIRVFCDRTVVEASNPLLGRRACCNDNGRAEGRWWLGCSHCWRCDPGSQQQQQQQQQSCSGCYREGGVCMGNGQHLVAQGIASAASR